MERRLVKITLVIDSDHTDDELRQALYEQLEHESDSDGTRFAKVTLIKIIKNKEKLLNFRCETCGKVIDILKEIHTH